MQVSVCAPDSAKVPSGQATHEVAPMTVESAPAGQGVQLEAPAAGEK